MNFLLNLLRATQAEFREILLPAVHAAEYTGVALGNPIRCDLN
jgi:hypothetical protein